MHWADELKIETPEQIDLTLEVAGIGSRFYAQVVDWAIKWGLFALVALLAVFVMELLGISVGGEGSRFVVLACLIVFFYAFLLGFDICFEVRHNGQTPGKRLAGIRVIREGGAPLDFTSACVRNLLGLADFLPGFYLLGGFLILLNARGQRLGDMAAGTIVIRERSLELPAESLVEARGLATDAFVFNTREVAACSPGDRHILKSFFQRYRQMAPLPRQQLALRLARTFLAKTGYEPATEITEGTEAEVLLASLYRDLEANARHSR